MTMADKDLDLILRAARDDTTPLGDGLRARILADAVPAAIAQAASGADRVRAWIGGLVGVPAAAVLGLWLGMAQPTVVLEFVPADVGVDTADAALMDEIFGTVWSEEDAG